MLWTFVYTFLVGPMFSFYLGMKFLGYMVTLCLIFWGVTRLFSTTAAEPFSIPTSNVQGFNFSTSVSTIVIVCLFNFSHPGGSEVVSHCGLDLHFLMINDVAYLSMFLLPIVYFFWRKFYSSTFLIFKMSYLAFIVAEL